jgi:hypothetical protein
VQLTHGNTVLRASVNDWKIELFVGGLQFNEKIENHVDDLMRPRVFSVDLVNYDDRLQFIFQGLAQHKTRLRLWPVVGVDNEQYAVHHFHDALNFAAEIGVSRCIDDVDAMAVPVKSRILGANRDSFFTLKIHRIHHALFDLLIGTKRP